MNSALTCTEIAGYFKVKMKEMGGRQGGGGMLRRVREVKNYQRSSVNSTRPLLADITKVRIQLSHGDWKTEALSSGAGWSRQ